MRKTELSIPKMDCPTEEQMIRLKISGLSGIHSLKFDLSTRQLEVIHSCDLETITAALTSISFSSTVIESVENADIPSIDNEPRSETKTLFVLLAINASMFLLELVIGLIGDSVGVLADSIDMLADALVYSISLYAVGKSASRQAKAAKLSGYFQGILAFGIAFEAIRRFFFESNPNITLMITVSTFALAANIFCLLLLNKHKKGGQHMKASWIFSVNDVLANIGVIVAALLVYVTNSPIPDLIIGIIIASVVFRGSRQILAISRSS